MPAHHGGEADQLDRAVTLVLADAQEEAARIVAGGKSPLACCALAAPLHASTAPSTAEKRLARCRVIDEG